LTSPRDQPNYHPAGDTPLSQFPHKSRRHHLGQRTALPVMTRKQIEAKRHHGYFGGTGGVPMILHLCRLTGATVLTPFVLAEEAEP